MGVAPNKKDASTSANVRLRRNGSSATAAAALGRAAGPQLRQSHTPIRLYSVPHEHRAEWDKRPQKVGLYDPEREKDSCGVGFIAKIDGTPSHSIVKDGFLLLSRMEHRGASGRDPNEGDGAGMLVGTPDEFLRRVLKEQGVELPPQGQYGVGTAFLSKDRMKQARARERATQVVESMGHRVLAWRKVPVNGKALCESAMASEPAMEQLFVAAKEGQSQVRCCARAYEYIRTHAGVHMNILLHEVSK